jgi:Lon protease-like protein
MVLLRGDWRREYHAHPDVYPIGCVGRIEKFDLLPDGRSNLVLQGLERFEIVEELGGLAYRRARVRWTPAAPEEAPPGVREQLRQGALGLLAEGDRSRAEKVWSGLPTEWDKLVNLLSFGLPFGEVEKLALLECTDTNRRALRLLEIIEFRLAEQACLGPGFGDNEPRH